MNCIKWEDYLKLIQENCVEHVLNDDDDGFYFSKFKSEFNVYPLGNMKIISYGLRDEVSFFYGQCEPEEQCYLENYHAKDFIAFYFCLGGKVKLSDYKSESKTLNKGDFAFQKIPEGMVTLDILPTDEAYRIFGIHFTQVAFEKLMGDRMKELPQFLRDGIAKEKEFYQIDTMPHDLYAQLKTIRFDIKEGLDYQLYLESKVYELLSFVIRQYGVVQDNINQSKINQRKTLFAICEKMCEDLIETTSLKELARKFDLTEDKIVQLFKQELNTTPTRFLKEYKLLKAKEVLKQGREDVNSTAFLVGYNSVSSFSRAFTKKFNARPGSFIPH